jgi:hypothetical protein
MKIYQVEVSNYCNLSCSYCPHPNQKRDKGNMTFDTFVKAVALAQKLSQTTMFLHNFGEPLLNPNLCDYIDYATINGIDCSFFTNGVLLDSKTLLKLSEKGLKKISISEHTPFTIDRIERIIQKFNIPILIEGFFKPTENLHEWAGQVKVPNIEVDNSPIGDCIFERYNAFVILWNGDVANCCIDCDGISVKTNITRLLSNEKYSFYRSVLCDKCRLMRGEESL